MSPTSSLSLFGGQAAGCNNVHISCMQLESAGRDKIRFFFSACCKLASHLSHLVCFSRAICASPGSRGFDFSPTSGLTFGTTPLGLNGRKENGNQTKPKPSDNSHSFSLFACSAKLDGESNEFGFTLMTDLIQSI